MPIVPFFGQSRFHTVSQKRLSRKYSKSVKVNNKCYKPIYCCSIGSQFFKVLCARMYCALVHGLCGHFAAPSLSNQQARVGDQSVLINCNKIQKLRSMSWICCLSVVLGVQNNFFIIEFSSKCFKTAFFSQPEYLVKVKCSSA